MSIRDKRRVLISILLAGFVCISMVVMTAYAAELRCENNELIARNEALRGEVDTLDIEIKTAGNIENLEKAATDKLGMRYPTAEECVYLTDRDAPQANFAAVLRRAAYK